MASPNLNEVETYHPFVGCMDYDFIDFFWDQYFHLRRGNAKDHHWDKLTTSFNEEVGFSSTKRTLKNKIDNLKRNTEKTYRGCQNFIEGHLQLGFDMWNAIK